MSKNKPKTPEKKTFAKKYSQQIHKVKDTITAFATLILLAAATLTAIFYVKGYRVDPDGGVKKTGVISINSSPIRATIRVDGEKIGKSPKTLATVEPGTYTVTISREGYGTWEKEITVVEGKATPIHAFLFKDNAEATEVLTLEEEIAMTITDQQKENIFIMTEKDITETLEPGTPAQKSVSVWQFKTSPFIWENANNPDLIFEETFPSTTALKIDPAPDGTYLLLTTTDAQEAVSYSLIDPYTVILNAPALPESLQDLIVSLEWNQDSDSLIVETEEFLIELHVPNFAQDILLPKNDTIEQWSTDLRGNFYYTTLVTPEVELDQEGEETTQEGPYYTIRRSANTDQEVIKKIHFIDTNQYIKDVDDPNLYKPFTMSTESARFAGEIVDFYVDTTANTIILKTDFALYHYNIETQKFTLISADEEAVFYAIDEDKERLIYTDSTGIYVFTFDKEEADYITKIGSKKVAQLPKTLGFVQWHTKSMNVLIGEDNGIYVVDIDGDNHVRLVNTEGFMTSDQSGDLLFNLSQNEDDKTVLNRSEVR